MTVRAGDREASRHSCWLGTRPGAWGSPQGLALPSGHACPLLVTAPVTAPGSRLSPSSVREPAVPWRCASSARLQPYSEPENPETSQLHLQEDLCKTSCGHRWFPAAAAFPPPSLQGFQIPLANRSLKMQIAAGRALVQRVQGYAAASPGLSVAWPIRLFS